MRKLRTYRPVVLRFRRWSRKGYAAFVSIQRAVTIGQLSANVSERFQTKNGSNHSSVLTFDKAGGEDAEEEENAYRPDSQGSRIQSFLFPQTVCPEQTTSRPAASCAHITNENISEIAESTGHKPVAFRDFHLYKYKHD